MADHPADRYATSRAMLERARLSLAGGVSSPFRAQAPVPLYFRDGCGSKLQDVDGNWYIDYTLAWGPNILGYRHPRVVETVLRYAAGPHTYGAQHELEFLVAEKICELAPCAERVIFSSSGSEAVQLALRLARAATKCPRVLKFEGHYHGWMDSVLISYHPPAEQAGRPFLHSRGQVANTLDNIAVATWNSLEAVEQALAAGDIAAVIMEPVLCNSGCILPRPGYLEGVRQLCTRHGALLIFDEVITGFRMALGGAQGVFGVTPDLATFGKALAAGLPLSAVAGKREILDLMFGGGVAFGGSFNGNPVSLAGAHAALSELSRDDGAALAHANAIGERLMAGIQESARRHGVPLLVSGFGAALALHFTQHTELHDYADTLADDRDMLRQVVLGLLEEGVQILPDGRLYVSAVHSDEDVETTMAAVDRCFSKL